MDKRLRQLPALRCFDAAARHQSYSLAAAELAITQAAVSQQIRTLESALGVKLFKRNGRQMLLTSRGNTLAEHVARAFEQVIEGFNKVQCEPLAGLLTVTSTITFASRWLMPKLWRFKTLHPEILVRVTASSQYEELKDSEIDVAIRAGHLQFPGLEQIPLFDDPIFPVCSTALMQKHRFKKPRDLLKSHLIEGIHSDSFNWNNWFNLAGVDYQPEDSNITLVETSDMAISAASAGEGVFLCCNALVGAQLSIGELIRPFDLAIEPGIRMSFVYDPDNPRRARIQAFYDWLHKELAQGIF